LGELKWFFFQLGRISGYFQYPVSGRISGKSNPVSGQILLALFCNIFVGCVDMGIYFLGFCSLHPPAIDAGTASLAHAIGPPLPPLSQSEHTARIRADQ
jgi:hypothetical protein